MDYRTHIITMLEDASQIARDRLGRVSSKTKSGDNQQVVTETDLEIGTAIIEAIHQSYPAHNIIDEEAGIVDNKSPYTWVIDPIDGTSNFAQGSPLYGCMVGLLQEHEPIAGGFALPAFHEIYSAQKGHGAYCNQQRLQVKSDQYLLSSLIAYGIDGYPEEPDRTRKECELLAEITLACRSVLASNSVFDTAMLVKGIYGGFLHRHNKIWDNVAQQIVLEEAGFLYTDFFGQPVDYMHPFTKVAETFTFCAAPQTVHSQLQDIITIWKKICVIAGSA